jgi:hypothetical protein
MMLELFTVKDAKASTCDLAEELQHALFGWTWQHDEGFSNWRESVLTGEKYHTESIMAESALMGTESRDAESATLNTPGETSETSDLAKQISDLINNPDLPEPIQDGLKDAIIDTFNSHISQKEITNFEDSPVYIDMVLRGYADRHK